jgi:nicotinamide mononucleotide (NMN) deamidase PncC
MWRAPQKQAIFAARRIALMRAGDMLRKSNTTQQTVKTDLEAGRLIYVTTAPTLIEQIHAAGRPFVIAVTGGGSGVISALLQVPGASASVLEAIVPYASTALADWLGGTPDHYCSERTARAMAMAAFERARRLSKAAPHTLLGIGATASLASTRPKRGAHRIHIAWQSADTTAIVSCTFPSEGIRAAEEQMSTGLLLDAIADACVIHRSPNDFTSTMPVDGRNRQAPTEWTELLLGQRRSVSIRSPGAAGATRTILFPGAFNPVHAAHKRMAEIAAERFGCPTTFELSISNVDKPPLDFIEIADRLAQFPHDNVLLTRAPTFAEKAELAPGCVFVVGIDTLTRIGDPVYYGGDSGKLDAAIASLANSGCRFLVFGRALNTYFRTLSEVDIPPALRALCDEVPESDFREDVSSTELRA